MIETGEVEKEITTPWGAEAILAYHPNLPDVLVYVDPNERGGKGEVVAFVNKKADGTKWIEETPNGVNYCFAYTDSDTAPVVMLNTEADQRAAYILNEVPPTKPGYDPENVKVTGAEGPAHIFRLNMLLLVDPNYLNTFPDWDENYSTTRGQLRSPFSVTDGKEYQVTIKGKSYKFDLSKPLVLVSGLDGSIGYYEITPKSVTSSNIFISLINPEYGVATKKGYTLANEVTNAMSLTSLMLESMDDKNMLENLSGMLNRLTSSNTNMVFITVGNSFYYTVILRP